MKTIVSSTDEWIYRMEYYSDIVRKEIVLLVTTWKSLEGIMHNEISRA
jgi:hypothetical protein